MLKPAFLTIKSGIIITYCFGRYAMYKVLIVEDDQTIAAVIEKQLQSWGYVPKCVEDFTDVLSLFASFSPQLVLLDLSLPFRSGYFWCQEIRKLSNVPIIFVSSAADNMNIVMAMNAGADDFIAKPFDIHVLIAKVQALLRRTYEFEQGGELIEHRGVILNVSENALYYDAEKLELTRNEMRILYTLLTHRGHTVSRESLMLKLWESDCYIDDNTLTVNVTRLRQKLKQAGITDYIQTRKGEGYRVD